jgi:F0F1-type ATP synthase membrane subunit b/b'
MKRAAQLALLILLGAGLMFAEGSGGGDSTLPLWKWANFLLLAGGLMYLAGKMLPPLFAARSQSILKDISESGKIRQDADARAAEVDRRLAGLETEIARLREDSQRESQAETQRLAAHTAAEIAKIHAQAEQEIGAAGKAARAELKRYAAELAVGLAEQKIRARMTPATEDGLVRGFVRNLQ